MPFEQVKFPGGIVLVITGPEELELIKKTLSKALNCWDTAPAELKTFADIVIEGKPLQDYLVWSNKN
jgi:hypothetical protein